MVFFRTNLYLLMFSEKIFKTSMDKIHRIDFCSSEAFIIVLKDLIDVGVVKLQNQRFRSLPFLVRFRLYCILTGRQQSVLPRMKLSRIAFRHLVNDGKVNGVRRTS
jgi:ribosomal protein S14